MNKILRTKGEKFLIQWGNCIQNMDIINSEIERVNSKLSISSLTTSISNQEDITTYNKILNSHYLSLQKMLSNYAFINSIILSLEDYHQQVIKLRYINKLSWQAIALETHISLRTCFNIKNNLIIKILDIIN